MAKNSETTIDIKIRTLQGYLVKKDPINVRIENMRFRKCIANFYNVSLIKEQQMI